MYCKHLRPIERKIEQNPKLNLVYAAAEMCLWGILAFLLSLIAYTSDAPPDPTANLVAIAVTVVWHFILFYLAHRHIFNYEYPAMVPHMMGWKETHPIVRAWNFLLVGQLLLVASFTGHWIMGLVCSTLIPPLFLKYLTRELPVEFEQGTKPVLAYRAQEHYDTVRPPQDPGVFFGGMMLPTSEFTTHMKIIGSTRSGKTNLLRLFMQSALVHTFSGVKSRAIIYDPKTEFPSLLAGMGIGEEDLLILNPFDARAYAWDMAKDLTDDRDAEAFADIMVPTNPQAGAGKFFDDATRILLGAIVKLYMQYAPGQWTLRDVILGCQSIELLSLLLENDPDLRADLRAAGSGDTAQNVMATLATVTRRGLKTVAAYEHYHHTQGRTFTIEDWMRNTYILLLGCDRRSKATLQPLNQLMMTRISQMVTSQQTDGQTYIILDELPELGKIGDIDRVAKLGASYGVCLSIAFQVYSDVEKIYGKETANSLIGQCDKSAYLRVLDHQTADWSARQIGQTKVKRKMKSYSAGYSASGKDAIADQMHGLSEQTDKEYPFPPEHFLNMGRPDEKAGTGVSGVYKAGSFVYTTEVSSQFLSKAMMPESANVPAFIEITQRPKLPRWTREDVERLNFAEVLQGVSMERLEGTDLHDLLYPGEISQALNFEPIPLPSFLNGGEGDDDAGLEDTGEASDSSNEGGRDIDLTNRNTHAPPSNFPGSPQPKHSPRR